MSLLVSNCPRCGAKDHTFDVYASILAHTRYGGQRLYETFCCCRACNKTTIFVLVPNNSDVAESIVQAGIANTEETLNKYFVVEKFINISDLNPVSPPEHLTGQVRVAFEEAARTLAIGCWNAAGCMFRSCMDIATKKLLPEEETEGLSKHARRYLAPRLEWLFDSGVLPEDLRTLSSCVREDGNDAVHEMTLKKEDAEDLLDFTVALLERIYTEPGKLNLAFERRNRRRQKDSRN